MPAQPSLLDLLEQSIVVAKHANAARRAGAPVEAEPARPAVPNPFRKRTGVCTHHEHEHEERLFWCHVCGGIGCMEWLKDHKDAA